MSILEDLLKATGCAEDLAERPTTWAELMTAVAADAIHCDQIATFTMPCIELAEASGERNWDEEVIEALFASNGQLDSDAARSLIACGKAADAWLALHN